MRQLSRILLFFTLVCCIQISARANHIYGADFYYEHISGNTYRINLVIYADCIAMNYSLLKGSIPKIQIRNGSSTISTIALTQQGSDVDVTPVCTAEKDNTQCSNPLSTIPGVGRFIYTGTYTFSGTSANWHFYFDGDLSSSTSAGHRAGRATNITNISANSVIAMDAALNNIPGPNSSPTFTTIPTPFYCNNVPQQYNPGAVDINNDSLSYSLIPGLNSTLGTGGPTVNYVGGASATAPLTTATGSFTFSSTTGQLSFTPSAVQRSLVVQQVTEYRNGVIVGTAVREMTFIVLNTCNNTPSTNNIDTNKSNIHAAVRVNPNTVNICYGTSVSQFLIKAINPGGDTIDASVTGLPAGASATITQNNTPDPIIQVDWNLPTLAPGNYNFFVTYRDNGCPLSSVQTQAYTVSVIRPYFISTSILAPTQCFHKAYVGFNLAFGVTPRHVTVSQNGTTVAQYVDNTGSFADSLAAGIYSVTVSSPDLPCSTNYSLLVVDSGVYPNVPKADPIYYCLNDPATVVVAVPDSGATLSWYTIEGKQLSSAPIPRTDTAGIFLWLVAQKMKVCKSLTDTVKVYVTKRPVAEFTLPPSICVDDTATIVFSGSIGVGPILEYKWNWGDAQIKSGQDEGPWRVYWHTPGKKTIKLTVAENKCSSSETQHTLIVRPNPYAGFDIGNAVCEYDTLRVTYNSKPFDGQKYLWSFQDADTAVATGPGPYLLRWHNSGTKVIKLTVDLDGCTDSRATEVTIHPAPDARILNAPGPVCVGDKIYLKADGGVSYAWSPADSLLANANGEIYAQILKPTVYRVKVTSDFGCLDSAAINYSEVEPCCQFSYPNAFTPNGDGRNDRFRIVTYGNQLRYELSIYNNWGQRVYYGLDSEEGWDGQFRGKPCEGGTYFYYLNATCFTGRQETHKGDLMLIR